MIAAFEKIAPGIKVISRSNFTLLGSPLMLEAVETTARQNLDLIKKTLNELHSLNCHTAYYLLKNCFAVPKLMYFLRTTPIWLFPSFVKEADDIMRTCLESILNMTLDDKNWLLASLPIKFGGLGVRKINDICLPAFLASACGVLDFVKSVLSNYSDNIEICHLAEAVKAWSILNPDEELPAHPEIQKSWDNANILRIHHSLVASSPSDTDQARYLAIREKEAGSWLRAIPSSNIGTLMDDMSFRISVGLRLGSKICHPHICPCGAKVDHYGHHGLSCPKNTGRYSRHSTINDIIKRALISSGFPTILEPIGISRSDGKRPDGLTLIPWAKGKSLLWDATCVDTLAPSHLSNTSKQCGSAAISAVSKKKNKYSNIIDNYVFVVFAVETLGPWCTEAKDLVNEIGRKLTAITGDFRSAEYLRQRISIAIQRGNVTSVMGTN